MVLVAFLLWSAAFWVKEDKKTEEQQQYTVGETESCIICSLAQFSFLFPLGFSSALKYIEKEKKIYE